MYSAIVVEVAMCVCSLEAQMMGQPTYKIIQPKRDLAVDWLNSEKALDQFPQYSVSA
jgi:hypothetical protein